MNKVVFFLDAKDRNTNPRGPDQIVRRMLLNTVPRIGETVWVSKGTDCAYDVERIIHMTGEQMVELHFTGEQQELEALLAEEDGGWRDSSSSSSRELCEWMRWADA